MKMDSEVENPDDNLSWIPNTTVMFEGQTSYNFETNNTDGAAEDSGEYEHERGGVYSGCTNWREKRMTKRGYGEWLGALQLVAAGVTFGAEEIRNFVTAR